MTDATMTDLTLPVESHPLRDDADWWRVRDLLVAAYPLTGTAFNWEIRRWDGSRFHNDDLAWREDWTTTHQLWLTDAGQVVGMVHPDYPGNASLQLHPDYRPLIEEPMIEWAEAHLSAPVTEPDQSGTHFLEITVMDYDSPRQRLLEKRGYSKTPDGMVSRRLRFNQRVLPPAPALAEGYRLRTTDPTLADGQRVADLLNAAFRRSFHNGQELLNFMTHSPSFRQELDLVAEAPDGSFAAYISLAYEPTHRYAVLEPVCTHPDHQRHGLARALILEGLHRVRMVGAIDVYVDTGIGMAANHLYEACGFDEAYIGLTWRKVFDRG